MTRSRKHLAALGLAALCVLAAGAALLEWWRVAVALLALLNGVGLVVLVEGVAHRRDFTRVDSSLDDLEKRLEKVAARVVATGEATRVELIDRLSGRG